MKLVASEIKVPAGYAVKLAEHTLFAELMNSRRSLLCSCVFVSVAEHINARYSEAPVRAHCVADNSALRSQSRFIQNVTCQSNFVFGAPVAHGIRKALCKKLGCMVVITVSCNGSLAVGKLPDNFGKSCKNILVILFTVGFGQAIGPRKLDSFFIKRIVDTLLFCEIRFVGKNCGNSFVKLVTDNLFISFVSDLNEFFYCFGIESVNITLIVKPCQRVGNNFKINIPFIVFGFFVFTDFFIAL